MNTARLLLLFLLPFTTFAEETVDTLIKELPVPDAEKRDEVFGKLIKLGDPAITQLCKKLVDPGTGNDLAARYALHGLAVHAQRKGGEADRAKFSKAMAAELAGEYTKPVKGFIIRQLHHAGGPEAIQGITPSLLDADKKSSEIQDLATLGFGFLRDLR